MNNMFYIVAPYDFYRMPAAGFKSIFICCLALLIMILLLLDHTLIYSTASLILCQITIIVSAVNIPPKFAQHPLCPIEL